MHMRFKYEGKNLKFQTETRKIERGIAEKQYFS